MSEKKGIVELTRGLATLQVEILATGGTLRLLDQAGIPVVHVSHYTAFPEILGGRVKTLHPKVHGGILASRRDPSHMQEMEAHGILPLDMVVANLYPFEAVTARPHCSVEEAVENIDIGGPAMIRAAAKNYVDVTVVVDPDDYPSVLREMYAGGGAVSTETNRRLAQKAFQLVARYDGAIADYFGLRGATGPQFGETLHWQFFKVQDLRYGENPHQVAAWYRTRDETQEPCVVNARQLQGREISFNNVVDANAALELVKEFSEISAVVVKHTNPCGVATSTVSLADAFRKARAGDPVSIFGGIVGCNRVVDTEAAQEMGDLFLEIIIAPGFTPQAREIFSSSSRHRNIRLLEVPFPANFRATGYDFRKVVGGLLVQERDLGRVRVTECPVVTRRQPTTEELQSLDFAWTVCKHVKSNAIVFARRDRVVGVGAGQMSRVDAAKLAVMRARSLGMSLEGTGVASDAFFPFRDGVDVVAEAGATAIIQPGGSLRDREAIQAADEHGMAMIFTGMRHFCH